MDYGILTTKTDWSKVRQYGRLGANIEFDPRHELELWTFRYHMRKRRYNRLKGLMQRCTVLKSIRQDVHAAKKQIQRIHFGF